MTSGQGTGKAASSVGVATAARRRRRRVLRWRTSLVFGSAVVVLTLHAGAGIAAVVLLPRGFDFANLHTWSDTGIPAIAAGILVLVLIRFVFFRSSPRGVALASAAIAGGWAAALVTGRVLFPVSMTIERCLGPGAITLALVTLAWAAKVRPIPSLGAAALGAGLGVVEILAQRAPPPTTRPAGGALAVVSGEPTKDDASTGQVSFPCGREHIRVRPLLTFERRSPDATWPMLAPADALGPHRRFDAFVKDKNGFRAHYTDDGESTVVATKDAKGVDIDAISSLPHAVYSDRNTFTTIHVPFAAWVSFGPTGHERFAAPSDAAPPAPAEPAAPAGEPSEVAHFGGDLVFRVLRGDDPRIERARGHLGRDEALTIEIGHRDRDTSSGTCRLTIKDWAAQASTDPVPGLPEQQPENTIEVIPRGNEVTITLALARPPSDGWPSSVGHSEGTYRNRIRVDTTMDPPRAP